MIKRSCDNIFTQVKNILYDFDGTLVDTAPDIILNLKKAYKNALDQDININRSIVGPPLLKMIEKISPDLTEDEVREVVSQFRILYDNSGFPETKLFSRVKEMLSDFHGLGLKQFIVTNKPNHVTKLLINNFKIDYFKEIVNSDSFPDRKMSKEEMVSYIVHKYNLKAKETVVVGDAASDILAAKRHSLLSIGILAGYDSKEEIEESKPDISFLTINDFYIYLSKIIKQRKP